MADEYSTAALPRIMKPLLDGATLQGALASLRSFRETLVFMQYLPSQADTNYIPAAGRKKASEIPISSDGLFSSCYLIFVVRGGAGIVWHGDCFSRARIASRPGRE
jgi:hypothetical protein